MKKITIYITALLLSVSLLTSCADKKTEVASKTDTKENASELLSGTTSKNWHISKQTDAAGDKQKVTSEEKDETLNMFADGKFSITDSQGTSMGTWTTEGTHTLVMHFDGKDVTENFTILDLSKEKVVLKAADGSEMVLKEK